MVGMWLVVVLLGTSSALKCFVGNSDQGKLAKKDGFAVLLPGWNGERSVSGCGVKAELRSCDGVDKHIRALEARYQAETGEGGHVTSLYRCCETELCNGPAKTAFSAPLETRVDSLARPNAVVPLAAPPTAALLSASKPLKCYSNDNGNRMEDQPCVVCTYSKWDVAPKGIKLEEWGCMDSCDAVASRFENEMPKYTKVLSKQVHKRKIYCCNDTELCNDHPDRDPNLFPTYIIAVKPSPTTTKPATTTKPTTITTKPITELATKPDTPRTDTNAASHTAAFALVQSPPLNPIHDPPFRSC